MYTLAELQRRFSAVVKDESLPIDSLPSNSTRKFDAHTRVEIYRYAYHARIVEALEEAFSWTVKVLGKKKGKAILRQYLFEHPSRFRSIDEVGQTFPKFIASMKAVPKLPYLSELARFDWVMFLCAVSSHGGASRLIRLKPSTFLFDSAWPVNVVPESGKKPKSMRRKRTRLLVYRHSGEVWWSELSKKEFEVLSAIGEGMSVENVGALLLKNGFKPKQAQRFFMEWSSRGAFSPFKQGKAQNV